VCRYASVQITGATKSVQLLERLDCGGGSK